METNLQIDVVDLDAPHRRALEEVMGRELDTNQRLIISVVDAGSPQEADARPRQTIEQWAKVYDGLSDEEIEEIDQIIKTRANLYRNLP